MEVSVIRWMLNGAAKWRELLIALAAESQGVILRHSPTKHGFFHQRLDITKLFGGLTAKVLKCITISN